VISDVTQRLAQIERLLAPATTPTAPAPASTTATGFSQALALASAPAGGATPYAGEIAQAAQSAGVDPSLLTALVKQESGFDPNARSAAGAQGLTQLMPATAASLGVTDPLDPAQSLAGGAAYLRQQLDRFGGDVRSALAAYNAGPGAVEAAGGVPAYPETQQYVAAILGNVADGQVR